MWLKIVTGESIYGKIVIDDITNLTMETRPVTAIIPQMNLFAWNEIQTLGDLERLRLVLDYMPDEALMRTLERRLSKGRDDDPVRAVWNSILAGTLFQHDTVEKLRRELMRNGQLREMSTCRKRCRDSGSIWRWTARLSPPLPNARTRTKHGMGGGTPMRTTAEKTTAACMKTARCGKKS